MRKPNRLPITVNEAIEILIETLLDDQKERIRKMSESELTDLHFGLGMWIRNSFGLLASGSALLKDAGMRNADDASALISKLLWYRLRGEPAKASAFLEEFRNGALDTTQRVAIIDIEKFLGRKAD